MTNSNKSLTPCRFPKGEGSILSRTECNAMRGVAILGIVLHNYCHWLGFAVKENEYTFTQGNVTGICNQLTTIYSPFHPSSDLIIHLLSFFGHYGVPVFLFLSAYGLTLKYENVDANVNPNQQSLNSQFSILNFLAKHFAKLWWMMIVGFAGFTMVDYITRGPHHYEFIDVVAQLGLFNNLLPNPDHVIWPGPYWFFGLMMQLYIVYRLLLYKRHWSITVGLMVVCTILQMLCAPESEELNRLRYNCIGGIVPFGLGLLFARWQRHFAFLNSFSSSTWSKENERRWTGGLRLLVFLFIITTILIVVLSFNYWTWFFVPVLVCIFAVLLVKLTPAQINAALAWVGGISSAMFVCHPITRKILIPISRHGDVFTGLLLYIVATFVLSMIFQRLMKIIKP